MKKFVFFILILSGFSFSSWSTALPSFTFTDFYDFFDQYEVASAIDKPTLISDYISWQNSSGGGFPAIINDTHVVFIYYNATETVITCLLSLDIFDWNNFTMIRLDTDLPFFYYSFTIHPETRADYIFFVNDHEVVDPRNPHCAKVSWDIYLSELAMPRFTREIFHIYRSDIPHGTLTPLSNYSTDPYVQIYLPPNYNSSAAYPVVYFPDGSLYVGLMDTPTILDNLIADNLITPVIALFTDPPGFDPADPFSYNWDDRGAYYSCEECYLADLDAYVNYVDANYPTINHRGARLHVGLSLTGYISAIVAFERPDIFRNIAIQSMTLKRTWVLDVPIMYRDADSSLDLNFWMCSGTYDEVANFNRTEEVERVAQFLQNKTYDLSLHFHPEGHSFAYWAHTMDELLIHFFPVSFTPPTTDFPITADAYSSASSGSSEVFITNLMETPPATISTYFIVPIIAMLLFISLIRRKNYK